MNRIAWLLLLLLAACAEYQTDYRLDAPTSDEGRACVAACDKHKGACHKRADEAAPAARQRCEDMADSAMTQCQSGTNSVQEKNKCYRPVCAVGPSYDDCDTLYRVCFAECGGQVWSRKECVKNC